MIAFAKVGLHTIKAPSGKWVYVGSVPVKLSYPDATDDDAATISQCGPGIAIAIAAKQGRELKSVSYDTREEAVSAANAAGYECN